MEKLNKLVISLGMVGSICAAEQQVRKSDLPPLVRQHAQIGIGQSRAHPRSGGLVIDPEELRAALAAQARNSTNPSMVQSAQAAVASEHLLDSVSGSEGYHADDENDGSVTEDEVATQIVSSGQSELDGFSDSEYGTPANLTPVSSRAVSDIPENVQTDSK